MPNPYTTVYQIMPLAPDWPLIWFGVVPLIVGGMILWGIRRFKWTKRLRTFAILSCIFGVISIARTGLSIHADWKVFRAYQKGEYQTIEGVVSDFRPMPYQGHQDECFSVQDQRFCYSDFEPRPGFHNAASHGGPIRSGLHVRIAYREGCILRLDIANDQILSSEQSAALTAEGLRQWRRRTENDLFAQKMSTASLFTAMCWTLWWNLQWKRVMRFWVKPPYRPWMEILFRLFFAANFIGAVNGFVRQLISHPLAKQDILPTIWIAAIMCAVVGCASASVLWMAERRDTQTALRA